MMECRDSLSIQRSAKEVGGHKTRADYYLTMFQFVGNLPQYIKVLYDSFHTDTYPCLTSAWCNRSFLYTSRLKHLAPVVRRLDSTIYGINCYLAGKC